MSRFFISGVLMTVVLFLVYAETIGQPAPATMWTVPPHSDDLAFVHPNSLLGEDAPPFINAAWRTQAMVDAAPTDLSMAFILNGELTTRYPAVGVLMRKDANGEMVVACTASLIDSETIVTAAHCVDDDRAGEYSFFLQHVGLIPAIQGSIVTYCDENPSDCGIDTVGQSSDEVLP